MRRACARSAAERLACDERRRGQVIGTDGPLSMVGAQSHLPVTTPQSARFFAKLMCSASNRSRAEPYIGSQATVKQNCAFAGLCTSTTSRLARIAETAVVVGAATGKCARCASGCGANLRGSIRRYWPT